jgi:hypothetical protein
MWPGILSEKQDGRGGKLHCSMAARASTSDVQAQPIC